MQIHNSYRMSAKTENFGLNMPDDSSKPTSLPASQSGLSNSERREAPRHPFIAGAEETDLASGARLSARVSELSLKGCYLDTLNPFPKGTRIRLVIFYGGETFTALATVIHPPAQHGNGHRVLRSGTGTVGSLVELDQRAERKVVVPDLSRKPLVI